MHEGLAMLTAQPEVHFTYSTLTGDYDKIGQPSLQDGVASGRLTCFSPQDNHGKVVSVSIQRPRPDLRAASVTRLGCDGCFL